MGQNRDRKKQGELEEVAGKSRRGVKGKEMNGATPPPGQSAAVRAAKTVTMVEKRISAFSCMVFECCI